MTDTSTVTVEVLDLSRLQHRGRVVALATVEVLLDGVAVILQGVRVLRRPDGLATVEMPCYRHTDGDMVPAVVVPAELEDAIVRAVLGELAPGAALVPV